MINEDDILNNFFDNPDNGVMYDELFQLVDLAREEEEDRLMTEVALNIENNYTDNISIINHANNTTINLETDQYYQRLNDVYQEIENLTRSDTAYSNYTQYFSRKRRLDNEDDDED